MNQKKDKKKTCFVSVESRKGGVGKTTAALCLAKLFMEKEWEVLFLDTDITGTNVVDALESAFWRDSVHIVRGAADGKKRRRANLLELFERGFMAGKGTPDFRRAKQSKKDALTWEQGKINVIGSEIYSDKRNELICKPSILFDELHAFWFVKYLREICNGFREVVGKDKRTAIVIDNSPGYVGIGPVIQEWLMDWGVDVNKFLFVSSLDEQDLTACLKGMDALHLTYTGKWRVAKKLAEQKNSKTAITKNGMPEWEGDEMQFVVRLLEDRGDDDMHGKLDFYLDRGLKRYRDDNMRLGDTFEEKIGKYQGIVVNRVAQRFKKGWWAYRINKVMNENGKALELLCDSEHRGEVSTNVMVEYNEYIESQFTLEYAVRRELEWRRHPEELEWICKSALDRCREKGSEKRDELSDFWWRLNNYQVVIDDLLGRLAGIPMYSLRDLVQVEWQPKAIGVDFQRWVWQAFQQKFPPFGEWTRPENLERRVHALEKLQEIVRIGAQESFHNKDRYSDSDSDRDRDRMVWDQLLFSGIVASTLVAQNWEESAFEEVTYQFGKLIGQMCAVEAEHWMWSKKSSKNSIAMFLAQEQLGGMELKENLFRKEIIHFFKDRGDVIEFYRSLVKAQARILDLDQDVDFLISVIAQAVTKDRSKEGLLPYIEGVAKKVIVNKSISHEQGMEECRKGFRIAESLGQFEGVLRKVIARWEIE